MSNTEQEKYLLDLLRELLKCPYETEWIEFKHDMVKPDDIGEYISALSNSSALCGKSHGYIVWGVDNATHDVLGTIFKPFTFKKGNEDLESWLLRLLSPKINFKFYELVYNQQSIVILEIERAAYKPVQFYGSEYIRIGSYKKGLKDYPEKERELWRVFDKKPFEELLAFENIKAEAVLLYLDYPVYFELLNLPLPENRSAILERMLQDRMIIKNNANLYNITNLGAILFAKRLTDFNKLSRKAMRVIVYNGKDRLNTIREQLGNKGYAGGFEGIITFVNTLLPKNEIIGKALRKDVSMYPELAVRELIANSIIHQDFSIQGTGPMIEIFSDRMEITNPGIPLVNAERFLDNPPISRNEVLASFMRRIGICEERGSGFDKVVAQTELYQLPAPLIEITEEHTRVVMFSHKLFNLMDKDDKIRACYLHSCLKYVNRDFMNNKSLRERFALEEKDTSVASRTIKDAVSAGKIKLQNPEEKAPRYFKYVPYWA